MSSSILAQLRKYFESKSFLEKEKNKLIGYLEVFTFLYLRRKDNKFIQTAKKSTSFS